MKRIIILCAMLFSLCATCGAEWVDLDSCVYVGCFTKNGVVAGKERPVDKETAAAYALPPGIIEIPYSYHTEIKDYYINPATISKNGNIVVAEIIEVWDTEALENAVEMRNEKARERNENAAFIDIKPITVYTIKYDIASKRNAVIKKVQMDEDFSNETVKFDNTGEDVEMENIHLETPSKAAIFYKLKEITKGM